MVDPKKVWRKVFGRYAIGTIVIPNKRFRRLYSACYVWSDDRNSSQMIPSDKMVGRIVRYHPQKKHYYIRWIADRRTEEKRLSFIWKENLFEELEDCLR